MMTRFLTSVAALGLMAGVAHADNVQVTNQATSSAAITPSDSTVLSPTSALFNGNATACNMSLKLQRDSAAVTWNNVQPGQILPVRAIQVMAATTCNNVVALYGP